MCGMVSESPNRRDRVSIAVILKFLEDPDSNFTSTEKVQIVLFGVNRANLGTRQS